MLGASWSLQFQQIVLTKHGTLKTLKSQHYADQRMHPVQVSPWNQWGWNQDPAQSLQMFCSKNSNPHTIVQVGTEIMFKSSKWTLGKCVTEQQNALPTCGGNSINLIPNHQTWIIRFNTHHTFAVNCVTGWNQTWKGGKRDQMTLLNPKACMSNHINWMAGEQMKEYHQPPPHLSSGRNRYSVHSWNGPWTIIKRHIWYVPKGGMVKMSMVQHPLVNLAATMDLLHRR